MNVLLLILAVQYLRNDSNKHEVDMMRRLFLGPWLWVEGLLCTDCQLQTLHQASPTVDERICLFSFSWILLHPICLNLFPSLFAQMLSFVCLKNPQIVLQFSSPHLSTHRNFCLLISVSVSTGLWSSHKWSCQNIVPPILICPPGKHPLRNATFIE